MRTISIHSHADGIGWDILIRMELLTPITSYMKTNKSFTRREIIRLGIDLCRALEVCQRYNIIHRDIKPANIFLSETEDFKLGDFGVARIASASTGASTRAGTVNYMAPEVFRGEKYTSNVDTYSLGLVMYQLLNANRMPLYPPYPQPMSPAQRERAQAQRLSGAVLPASVPKSVPPKKRAALRRKNARRQRKRQSLSRRRRDVPLPGKRRQTKRRKNSCCCVAVWWSWLRTFLR